jgi:hypothetical protein
MRYGLEVPVLTKPYACVAGLGCPVVRHTLPDPIFQEPGFPIVPRNAPARRWNGAVAFTNTLHSLKSA